MTIVCKAKASNLMHVLCVKPDVDLKINARWPRFYASQASAAACIPGKALFTPIPRKNKETMISAPSISSLSVQMHPLQSKTVPLRLITIIHTDQNTQHCQWCSTVAQTAGATFCQKNLQPFLDLCVSSLREGHANLLCIVPILTDVTEVTLDTPNLFVYIHGIYVTVASMGHTIWQQIFTARSTSLAQQTIISSTWVVAAPLNLSREILSKIT